MGDRIGFRLYQFWRNMGKMGYVFLVAVVLVVMGESGRLGTGSGRVGGVMSVCVVSLDYLC